MRIALGLAFLIMGPAAPVHAQVVFERLATENMGTRFIHSTRSAAMGGTGVADPLSSANHVFNPANAFNSAGISVQYTRGEFLDDWATNNFGVRYAPGMAGSWRWAAALHHQRWSYDIPIVRRTVFLPEGTGEIVEFDQTYTVASVAGAFAHGPWAGAVGVSGRYMTDHTFDHVDGWTFDLGARAERSWHNDNGTDVIVRAGAAVLDLDNGVEANGISYTYTNQWRSGAGVEVRTPRTVSHPVSRQPVSPASIMVSGEYVDQDSYDDESRWGLGIEVGLAELVYLRGGTSSNMPGFFDGVTWGLGLAAAIGPARVRIDVAEYPRGPRAFFERDNIVFGVTLDYLP